MIVRPMIEDWEIPSIEHIATLESRRLARLPVVGLAGDLQQDLGASSLAVEITGSLQGDQARDDLLKAVRDKFKAGDPVSFVADIVGSSDLDKVLIEALEIEEANDWADILRYRIVLRQYVEPPAPAPSIDALGVDIDADLDLEAALGFDGLELPDVLGELPALSNPVPPLKTALSGVQAATQGVSAALGGLKQKLGL